MTKTYIGFLPALLVNDVPDWDDRVTATFESVTQFEESLLGHEARRPHAHTTRMRLKQSYTLDGNVAFSFAAALRDYTTEPVLVPLYQSSVIWSDRANAPITSKFKLAHKSDWSQFELYTTVEPAWVLSTDYVCPVVWGRLESTEVRWLNDSVAKFEMDLIENGPEEYAISAKEYAFDDGPSVAGWDTPNRWVGPALTDFDKPYRPEYYDENTGAYTPNTFTPLANTGTNAALRINWVLIAQGRVELGEGVYTLGVTGSTNPAFYAAPYNMILFGDTNPIINGKGYPKDNVRIVGRGIGKTTLRICDNSPQLRAIDYTQNPPDYYGMPGMIMRMIYSTGPTGVPFAGQPCNNALVKGISFDANHNETNNNARSKNCISVFGSGTVVEDCEFFNVGVGSTDFVDGNGNPIGTPESFTVFAKLSSSNADGSQGAIVRRCIFRDVGKCTAQGVSGVVAENTCVSIGGYIDASTNYLFATGVVVEDCKVSGLYKPDYPTPTATTQRAPLHGLSVSITKGAVITRNFFDGYQGVCYYADTWPQIGTKIYNNKATNVWGFVQFSVYNWNRVTGAPFYRIPHFKDISITRNTATIVEGLVTYYRYDQINFGGPQAGFVVAWLYDYDLFGTYPGHTNIEVSGNAFTPSSQRNYVMWNIGGYWPNSGVFEAYPNPYTYNNPTIYETASGGIVGDFITPKIFTLPVDWREFGQSFNNKAIRDQIGFGRQKFEKVYTLTNASESELRAISQNQNEIGKMLRFFQLHGTGGSFWVPVWRSATNLAANIAAASVTFTVQSATGFKVGDWLAFMQPAGIVARSRVVSIVGTTITVSSAPGALSKDATVVAPLVLARVQRPRLQFDWSNDSVAEARFLVSEVPQEYFEGTDQITNKNLGLLLTRGYIYELSQTVGGTTTTTRLTSFERNLTVLDQTYMARKIDHGAIKQSLFLDRDEIDVRSDVIAADPFVKIATNQSEAPLRLTIKSVDVVGSVGTDSQVLFTGDVVSVSVKGSRLTAKAVSAGTVFDRQYPRFRLQVGCNHSLFSVGCGLLTSNWKFTGTITNPGTAGFPFEFVLGSIARVVGVLPTITAGWFAGGWIEIGSGASMVRRAIINNEPLSSGLLKVILSRDPTPFPAAGTTVALYPGCDGAFATCSSKFSNALNFGGHPFLPPSNPSMFRVSKNIGGGKK